MRHNQEGDSITKEKLETTTSKRLIRQGSGAHHMISHP